MHAFLTDLRELAFLQYAMAAGLLASVACGIVGSFVVVRRITYIAGGIAHCVLGGMGVARYLAVVHGLDWLTPIHGALVAAGAAALVIGLVSLRAREREDTVISGLWAVGMAKGVLFISKTPGYSQDMMSYLFGNILMVSPQDLWLIGVLDGVVVAVTAIWYHKLVAVCFDEEFARLRGVRVEFYYVLLLVLTAVTVVLLVSVVGIVMMLALLTLPVAVAGQFTRNLWRLMVLSTILCATFTTVGLAASYGPDLPAGALTIVLAGAVYLVVTVGRALFVAARRKASAAGRQRP